MILVFSTLLKKLSKSTEPSKWKQMVNFIVRNNYTLSLFWFLFVMFCCDGNFPQPGKYIFFFFPDSFITKLLVKVHKLSKINLQDIWLYSSFSISVYVHSIFASTVEISYKAVFESSLRI